MICGFIKKIRDWRPSPARLQSPQNYVGKNGIERDWQKFVDDFPCWAWGMSPHFIRLVTDWRLTHNFLNVLVEAGEIQDSGDYDATWVWGHLLGVPLVGYFLYSLSAMLIP